MNCLHCELTRAKMIAGLWAWAYRKPEETAAYLSKHFGENYYAKDGAIYRQSKIPPHKPHLIREKT